jgi:hypothetical protein
VCIALALLLLFQLWNPARGEQGDESKSDVRVMMLQQQMNDLDRKIYEAEAELRNAPAFNVACCIGWNLLFPLGTIIWLVTDVQSHSDAKRAIKDRISRLQSDKQNLQNQMMLLQSGK